MTDFETISQDDLLEMQAREEAATAGPWGVVGSWHVYDKRKGKQIFTIGQDTLIKHFAPNARFAAHARTDQPRLRIAYKAAVEHINRLRTAGETILQMAELIAELEAEIKRLKEQMTDSWEHTWKCRHKEERERLGLPLDGCICGLPEALRGKEGTEDETC